jgi:F-type H+-transporting ATPase subunit alpha
MSLRAGAQKFQRGRILSLKDGIAEVGGLPRAVAGELVLSQGNYGIVLNLRKDNLGVVFLTDRSLRTGSGVEQTGILPSLTVSLAHFGQVIDVLGNPLSLTDLGALPVYHLLRKLGLPRPIELKAPGILQRQSVYEPVPTGTKIVDTLIPVGQGQRELIIGDRQTGKTAIALDAIISQEGAR